MITAFCESQGVRTSKQFTPGPITGSLAEKSMSMFKPPFAAASSSRPIAPKGPERNEQWWEIMMCRCDTIQKEQSELKKEMEKEIRRRKEEDKMMRMLKHVSGCAMGSSSEPYVPTQEDEENTTEEESEIIADSSEPRRSGKEQMRA
ncbi:hypothetical protein RHSIM_Rhsim06G0160200 [Rhododendron simsii]|uniref:Uncharacterized protein n=1 Tax=Rhododendron simsii TaxID=118357 RepID=A0A834LJG6_RHOSS|nr:hypothetical protein RHSIM_Rhsim06G0160200 [Rhododendron simsii]